MSGAIYIRFRYSSYTLMAQSLGHRYMYTRNSDVRINGWIQRHVQTLIMRSSLHQLNHSDTRFRDFTMHSF